MEISLTFYKLSINLKFLLLAVIMILSNPHLKKTPGQIVRTFKRLDPSSGFV